MVFVECKMWIYRLEVTLEKAVEGVEWKRIVKDHSAKENRPHLPFSEGLDDLSAEDLLKVMRTLETQQQELVCA